MNPKSLTALVLVTAAAAQGPASPITDLNPFPAIPNPSSFPEVRVQVGSGPYLLTAVHPDVGAELWSVGFTGLGPALLADLNPGPASSNPAGFTRVGNLVFFTADDGSHGRELWVTDGTTAGTALVEDLLPGIAGATPDYLTEYQGRLYFAADDGQNGRELWRSDGTAAGTAVFASLVPGSGSGNPHLLTVANNILFFVADSAAGRELWKCNGTAAGTVLVRDIVAGGSSQPLQLTASGTLLYFTATTPASGRELWRSDGTTAGTLQLLEIVGGTGSPNAQSLTDVNGTLFFVAQTSAIGRELWKTTGAPGGTSLVADIWPGPTGSDPAELTADGSRVFFAASHAASGRELWRSDGTVAGTVLVADVRPGIAGANPSSLQLVATGTAPRLSTYVYFAANDGSNGEELWRSSGTAAGTSMIADLAPGAASSAPSAIVQLGSPQSHGNWLLFRASDGTHGNELWRTNGTAANTTMADLAPAVAASDPRELVVDGARTFFVADDGVNGREPWVTDGTPVGTHLLRDIVPGSTGSDPGKLCVWNGALYFVAYQAASGRELWRSDGTAAGTIMLGDIYPGSSGSNPDGFTAFAGALYFAAENPGSGRELFRTDGTAAGIVLVADVNPAAGWSSPTSLTVLAGRLLFAATDAISGMELWQTDGTAAGTALVLDIDGSTASSQPEFLTVLGDIALFRATGAGTGSELWRTDGTAAGTALVADLWPGSSSSSPSELTLVEFTPGAPVVCFAATSSIQGRELFRSDGTAAGTVMIRDVRAGAGSSDPRYLTRVQRAGLGDLLLLGADDGVAGLEPWQSSGSAASTVLLADVAPGRESSLPAAEGFFLSLPSARQVVFAASNMVSGLELWRHDLLANTTALHQDIRAGVFGSNPSAPVLMVSQLLFAAADGSQGREPWRMTSMAAAIPFGSGCPGSSGLVPQLTATDTPVLGNAAFGYRLANAMPGNLSMALYDFTRSAQPFGPCTLLVQPFVVQFAVANGAGVADYSLPITANPVALGVRIDAQGLVYDPPSPMFGLLCASNGVEMIIGSN